MDKKKIAIGLGVIGVAALGYYTYMKVKGGAQAQALLPQATQPNQIAPANVQPTSLISQYEGKGFRNVDDRKIYVVKGGVLRNLTTGAAMQRELGSDVTEQLVASGRVMQVDTTFLKQFTIGAPLSGISPAI